MQPSAGNSIFTLLARLVYLIIGVIELLLLFRFLLAALGANPANAFADFIYSISEPLARPFFSLFNYDPIAGISRFELGTVVAMVVYAIAGWVLIAVLRLPNQSDTV